MTSSSETAPGGIDFERARFNMIEQQIRPWEVLDPRVLDALAQVPREAFVPERYRNLAFADVRIPLGHGQTMMNPNVEGRLLQALQLRPGDRVLEIGTGSGYLTACLAHLAGQVASVDCFDSFTAAAAAALRAQGVGNVSLATGNAAAGWGGDSRYDAIAVTGSLPVLTPHWQQRLTVGGRLFVVVGQSPLMEALLITRTSEREWLSESLFETDLTPLLHVERAPAFDF
jgi:protein-L-isoaspartate(D-aspartate) O-methyltransferase